MQEYIFCVPFDLIEPNISQNNVVTQVHSVEDFNVQASDTDLANSQCENTSRHEVYLFDIVELPVIPPKVSKRNIRKRKSTILTSIPIKEQLEEKENRKRAKAEEIKQKSERKPLNKEMKRVLKNFNNIKEFNDPNQNTKEKEKRREIEIFLVFFVKKIYRSPVEDWIMCYVCGKWAHENCADGL
ncbi:hypothetical protein WA026_015125 [Henosepilachna vigintioctopunctata]|uniref:Uncharacterized protein n=1 Tax=Henosepilachna vigintioctopunctata TaxID=420089 RepID=A0AAW1TVY0_9CUCU